MNAVKAMHEGAQTVVRTTEGDRKTFEMKVGLYRGFVSSPLLSVTVMEIIATALRR